MPSYVSIVLKNPLYRFLLNAAGFYVAWYFIYDLWLHPVDVVDLWVVRETMSSARHILDLLGFITFSHEARLVGIDGTPGLWMGDNCDSVELCAIFTGFIISFPALWKRKAWYIPIGWVLITGMNILRIVALAITQKYVSKKWLDFNHTYTFTILVYAFIFLLWYIWVSKITGNQSFFKRQKKRMKKGRTTILLLLFAICFFTLGYFRNYIFLTVNDRASSVYYNTPSPPMTGIFTIFQSYNYNTLVTAKWVLTFLFTLLFTGLSAFSMHVVFHQRKYTNICLVFNGLIFALSLLFIAAGKMIYVFANYGFNISRSLAHLEQSPIITIILLLAVYYHKQSSTTA